MYPEARTSFLYECRTLSLFTGYSYHLQLESSDEQAAAIRRELDARQEKFQEMQRVSTNKNKSHSKPIFPTTMRLFTEQETDAQVRAEGDGVPVHRGDDPADQHPEEQPGNAARAAEQAVRVQNQSCQVQKEQVSKR